MKRLLTPPLLLTLLFPVLATGETRDDLVERDGIHYKQFSDVPFTGKSQGSFKNGKRHGPWVGYNSDGSFDHAFSGTHKNGVKVE